MHATPPEQQLAGEEEAEEEGGYDSAEDEVAPVGQVAFGHLALDVGGHHFRAKGISRKGPGPPVKPGGNDISLPPRPGSSGEFTAPFRNSAECSQRPDLLRPSPSGPPSRRHQASPGRGGSAAGDICPLRDFLLNEFTCLGRPSRITDRG